METRRTVAVPSLSAEERALLARVYEVIQEVEPGARIILYGSRARGDAAPDSDWDLLAVLKGAVDSGREETIRRRLYKLELSLESCPVLSAIIVSGNAWNDPIRRTWPFLANVRRDGLSILPTDNATGDRMIRLAPVETGEIGPPQGTGPLIEHLCARAREALETAELLAGAAPSNFCVSQLYDACFQAVSAQLLQQGLAAAKHDEVRARVDRHLIRTGFLPPGLGSLYHELFEARDKAEHEEFVRFTGDQVHSWLERTRQFVAVVEELIDRPRGG